MFYNVLQFGHKNCNRSRICITFLDNNYIISDDRYTWKVQKDQLKYFTVIR